MLPNPTITPIPNDEPDAVPSLWNTRYAEIDANFSALDERQATAESVLAQAAGDKESLPERLDEIADALGLVQDEFGNIAGTSAVSVQRAVSLDWLYRNNRVAFELWGPGFTMIDYDGTNIVEGVSGDDSIDVESTTGIQVGQYYVLHDATGSHLIRVQAILSESRLRMHSNLPRNFTSGRLSRCSMAIAASVRADTQPGNIWLSKKINIGTVVDGGAVVVRRTLNSGNARLYYIDSSATEWTERDWSTRRQGGEIPEGFADYEYALPMRGDGYLRLDIEGEAMTVRHIVALAEATGLGGFVNPAMRPNTPTITAPGNGSTGITERPTLAISGYSSPGGTPQSGVQFQIATSNTFATIRHDSGQLAAGLSYQLPAGVLAVNTTYYLRARTMDSSGLWSDWSAVVSFTTDVSFVYVTAPTLVSPANNAVDVPETPTLQTGAFATVGGSDTHAASRFQVRSASGTWASPLWDSGEDTTNLLSIMVPAGILLAGQSVYFIRAAHKGTSRGWSEFSGEIKITTKTAFANVSGIALITTGGNGGTWAYIDDNGNTVTKPQSSYFDAHPVWGGMQDVTIDGQVMVKIPKFYIKQAIISSGANAGKPAWWISDQPVAGYEVHPAFKNGGSEVNQIYVGKYQASMDGAKLASKPGVLPAVSRSLTQFIADAGARNVSGVSGFMLWSVYQWSAIQWLYLVEKGTMDSQTATGQGRVNASSAANVDASDVAQATYRGIVGLWGNVWQWMDGLKTSGGSIHLWDRDGNKTWVNTTKRRTAPVGTIYPTTFMDHSAATYDFADVFIGDTGPTSNSNATAPDYQYFNEDSEYFPLVGGYWSNASHAGLWDLLVIHAASGTYTNVGARLAKV